MPASYNAIVCHRDACHLATRDAIVLPCDPARRPNHPFSLRIPGPTRTHRRTIPARSSAHSSPPAIISEYPPAGPVRARLLSSSLYAGRINIYRYHRSYICDDQTEAYGYSITIGAQYVSTSSTIYVRSHSRSYSSRRRRHAHWREKAATVQAPVSLVAMRSRSGHHRRMVDSSLARIAPSPAQAL